MSSEDPRSPIMLAFTDCVPGLESEFNQWYDDVHGRDLVAVPGIAAAQRYLFVPSDSAATAPYEYLTIYKTEDTVESVGRNLAAARGQRMLSDAMGGGAMWTFQPLGPTVTT